MKPAGFPFLLAAIVLPFSALAREEHRFGVNCTSLSDCEPTYVCTGLPSLSYPQKIPPIPIYGTCGNCRVNADCGKADIECVGEMAGQTVNKVCKHKGLFKPFGWKSDLWGSVITILGSILAAGAGTGGGGLFVPVFVLLMHFTTKEAIPLSHAMIFGGALANLLFNSQEKHPLANRPLISMDITLVMEPLTLAGTVIGVYINVVSPEWLIVLMLVVLLGFTTYRTLQKTVTTFRLETSGSALAKAVTEQEIKDVEELDVADHDEDSRPQEQQQHPRKDLPFPGGSVQVDVVSFGEDGERLPAVPSPTAVPSGTPAGYESPPTPLHSPLPRAMSGPGPRRGSRLASSRHSSDEDSEWDGDELDSLLDGSLAAEAGKDGHVTLAAVMARESRFSMKKLALLMVAWTGMLVVSLLKGGEGAPSMIGIKGCSVTYWVLVVSIFPFLAAITVISAIWLMREERIKTKVGFTYLPGDPRWTPKVMSTYSTLCMLAGVAAGMLGIGGGMVKGPLLLELGVSPQTTAATAAFMILFTSAATTFQYLFLGLLPIDYGLWFMAFGFASSWVGQVVITGLVKKYKKTFFILVAITLVLALSTILLALSGVVRVLKNFQTGRHMGFESVC